MNALFINRMQHYNPVFCLLVDYMVIVQDSFNVSGSILQTDYFKYYYLMKLMIIVFQLSGLLVHR